MVRPVRSFPDMVISFVLRIVADVPRSVSVDRIVGEVEAVATGERFVVHDGPELLDVVRQVVATSSGAADVRER